MMASRLSSETRLLISTLLVIVDMLIAIFLEKSTEKGNGNSSIPSSQTEEYISSKPRKKANKQDEYDEPFANSHTRKSVEISPVCRCEHCGENLRSVPVEEYERRTRNDRAAQV